MKRPERATTSSRTSSRYVSSEQTTFLDSDFWPQEDIDELVELTDEIRSARRRRIHDIQRERSVPDIRPRLRPRVGMPPRAWLIEKRMRDIRDREWMNSR